MMKAATKPPIMLPRPPSTQIMKVSGPNVLPTKGCTSYCSASRQAASPASAPPTAEVSEVDLALVDAHQAHDFPILRDGADGGAEIGAPQEEIQRHGARQRHAEGEQAGVADEDVADLDDRQADADVAEIGAEQQRRKALQEEQQAAGGQQLVDRRGAQDRLDDEQVQQDAEQRRRRGWPRRRQTRSASRSRRGTSRPRTCRT